MIVLGCPKVPPPKRPVPVVEGFGAPKRFVCPGCCVWVVCEPPNKPPPVAPPNNPPDDCVVVLPNTVETPLTRIQVRLCNTHNHPFVVRAAAAVVVGQKDWYLYLELFRKDLL